MNVIGGPIASAAHGGDWDAIVVGAGLGGLSTAAFLAANGRRVLVLEQHRVVGGSSQVFRRHGEQYQFDVGVHQVGECEPGGKVRTLFAALGIDDRVEWSPFDPDGFTIITLPGVQMRVPVGWDAYADRLVETFPAEADGLRRCVEALREVAGELRSERSDGPFAGLRHALRQRVRPGRGLRLLATLFDDCGLSPEARAVVAGESGAYAAPPSIAPVAVHAGLLDHHLTSGTWYPRGGGQVIPARLAQVITAHGGEIRTDTRVDRIMVEGGRAVGVTLVDGTEIHSGVVVSNADPRRTYLGLVGREHLPRRLRDTAEQMRMALPLFAVHLVLDQDVRDLLPRSTQWIHPDPDLEASYAAAYAGRVGGPVPVFLASGTLADPTGTHTAPGGHSTLELVTVAPPHQAAWSLRAGGPIAGERYSRDAGYLGAKETLTEAVLDTASLLLPDLREHIVHCEASTPVTHERFTLATSGSAYGLELSRRQVGGGRPGVQSPIPGLFLTGAGTRYMPGVASTLHGGAGTAGAVLGRDLHAEMAAGRTYVDPAALPADEPGWDPLTASMPQTSTR